MAPVTLFTLVDARITPEFVAHQLTSQLKQKRCCVCSTSLRTKRFVMYTCNEHAACTRCARTTPACAACTRGTAQLRPMVVPIDTVKAHVGDDAVPFDTDAIRTAFCAVDARLLIKGTREHTAMLALARIFLENPQTPLAWHELWRIKQLTSWLNTPTPLPAWRDFINVLTRERLAIMQTHLPKVVDLDALGVPLELRIV